MGKKGRAVNGGKENEGKAIREVKGQVSLPSVQKDTKKEKQARANAKAAAREIRG